MNGKVIQRQYQCVQEGGIVVENWIEQEDELNTHEYGAATITLDEIYYLAKNDWLRKRDGVKYYFEANNEGMISICGYIEDICSDDCFIGVSIEWIKQSLNKFKNCLI
ncbi:MAG: hypothetical protein LBG19_02575 [Prevotellaceae bacterium]|jgi:hypothetical protein|nr:hypothetical protein [Prevotellaceae bacterium]